MRAAGSGTQIHKSESKSNPKHGIDIMWSVIRSEIGTWNSNTVAVIFLPFAAILCSWKIFCFVRLCLSSCDFHPSPLEREFSRIGRDTTGGLCFFFFLTSLANWRGEELWKLMQIKIANWEFCLSTGLIAWKGSSVSDSGQHQQINGYWDLNTSRMSQTALKCPYLLEINLAIQGFLLCLIERREGERGWEEGKG